VNLASIIDDHPAADVALVSRGIATTYGELREQVACLRGGLGGLGLRAGDQVAVLCGTNHYFVVWLLAIVGAGMVAVPINPSQPARETTTRLGQVRCRAAVVGPTGARHFATVDVTALGGLDHVIAPAGTDLAGATRLEELLAADPAPILDRGDDDPAVMLFTSGTAGAPRAAVLTHGNLLSNQRSLEESRSAPVTSADTTLCVLPLFHIFGLNALLLAGLRAGASLVLMERFDPVSTIEAIRRHGVTVLSGAPPMWTALGQLPEVTPADVATVRIARSGASALPPTTFALVRDRLGLEVAEGYGLTETSPVVTTDGSDGVHPGSIGRPVPGVEVRLVDSDGHEALVGDTGEIWVRGPSVFAGYWDDAEATRSVFSDDGWLRTGDLAVADDEGRLHLVDRLKDMIIVSGFNVFPAEVEAILTEHPAVAMAAVVGHPDPATGETVVAHVVLATGAAAEEDDIIDFCCSQMARYKAPTKVVFDDHLPIGASGKVTRRALRA